MDKEKELDFLKHLIAIDSAGGHEEKVTNFLVKTFAEHGIKTQKIKVEPDRYDLIAKQGNGNGPVLALEGHQDTVALGNLEEWHTKTFDGDAKRGQALWPRHDRHERHLGIHCHDYGRDKY